MNLLHYSWKEYLITLAIALVIYYIYVIIRYYRKDFIGFIKGKHSPDEYEETEIIDPFNRKPQDPTDPNVIAEKYVFTEELIGRSKEIIFDAVDGQLTGQEVLQSLKNLFSEYPPINDEILRSAISELILSECDTYGQFSLDKRAVDELWDVQSS